MADSENNLDPAVLEVLWDSSPQIRERYGSLTNGALLKVLRHLARSWEIISELNLKIDELSDSLLLVEEAYDDLLIEKAGGPKRHEVVSIIRD
jgi:hypothetical protein